MALTHRNTTFDCADAQTLAKFWSAALDRPLAPEASAEFAMLPARGPHELTWLFLQVPEAKSAKNRNHQDFSSDDRVADVARLVQLGAELVGEHDEYGLSWTTLRDVEGNEFCISDPHEDIPD